MKMSFVKPKLKIVHLNEELILASSPTESEEGSAENCRTFDPAIGWGVYGSCQQAWCPKFDIDGVDACEVYTYGG